MHSQSTAASYGWPYPNSCLCQDKAQRTTHIISRWWTGSREISLPIEVLPSIAFITMLHYLSLLLISSAFSRAFALPRIERPLSVQRSNATLEASRPMGQPNLLRPRSVEMDQTIASFTEQGLCFHYFAERPSSYADPCIKYCENHDGHGYSGVSMISMHRLLHSALEPKLIKINSVMLRRTLISTLNTVIRALSRPTMMASDGSQPLVNVQMPLSRNWLRASLKLSQKVSKRSITSSAQYG
jgi:hypothetical protein